MAKYNSGHAITFHSSVDKAQRFQERHQDLFTDIEAFHVNGKQTTNERSVTLNAFAQEHKSIVTNARCLTEGVDVPAIDAVYFCDQKNSKIDIVQAAGRALRRADHLGKQLGYIVVPIFHRNRDKLEEAIEEGAFNNLVSVVRALSSHDERLVDEIRKIKMGKGQSKSQSEHLVIEGALNLITIEEMGDLSDRLFDQLVSKIRVPWRSFEEARVFVHTLKLKGKDDWAQYSKNGNKPEDIPADPPQVYKSAGWISWGDWLGTKKIANFLRQFIAFEEAKAFVHKLKLKSGHQWNEYCKSGNKPDDIPSNPNKTYERCGWVSMGDWLGTGIVANTLKRYRPFEEARFFVHSLKLQSIAEWNKYCKNGNKPKDIPTNANGFYSAMRKTRGLAPEMESL